MVIVRLILRRLLLLVPIVLGITFAVFLLIQLSPANPALSALGLYATPAERAAFAQAYHLNDPIYVRYPRFLFDVLHGNLGVTTVGNQPVDVVIGNALPVTSSVALFAMLGALLIGFVFGVTAALQYGRWWDHVVRVFSMAGLSIPTFLLALLLIEYVAIATGWFPPGGYVSPTQSIGGWIQSLTLPALALAIPIGAWLTRIVRAAVIEELRKDYVRTARGAGLPEHVVIGRNVLRNALVAPLTVLGLEIGYLISGAVVVEVVFGLQGVGSLLNNAAQTGDVAVVQGIALLSALAFVVVNLVTDVLYLVLNPRVRLSS